MSYIGYCLILLCIFKCIASQSSITPEIKVADKATVDRASTKDTISPNENKNSSYVDKKNDKTQVKQSSKSIGLNATNPNDSTSATPSTVSLSTEVKPTSSVISDIKNEFTGNRNIGAGAVIRGFYVFVGLGAIVVMYIVVRTIRHVLFYLLKF